MPENELPEGDSSRPAEPEPTGPEPASPTDDELFAQLVAGFDEPVDAQDRSWPASEDLADLAPAPRPRPSIMHLPRVQAIPPVDPRSWTPEEDPDDEHFVPPPPPPLPPTEAPTRLAIAALIGGIVLIGIYLSGQLPGMAGLIGGAMVLGGAGTLVSRLKDDNDDDYHDPQSGAVV